MTKLSVNLNKFALLRNARGTDYPNVVKMAVRCIESGVHGITVHPRPDQRHITYEDVYDLSELLKGHPSVEFNVEGNPTPKFMEVVMAAKPDQCTLVPDAPDQLTSDHGWDLKNNRDALKPIVSDLQKEGIRVSIFMDPDVEQVELATSVGTDRIELYTESFARAFENNAQGPVWMKFKDAAACAESQNIGINAGHDLNLDNLGIFLEIPNILEVSIGHAIVVESFDNGLESTLNHYLEIIESSIH